MNGRDLTPRTAVAQVAMALLERATYIDLLAAPPPRSGESAYLM